MSYTCYNNTKSPKLKAVVLEPVLLSCINGITVRDLFFEMQRTLSLPYETLKKYLFVLINNELITYDGQKQLYITEEGGFDLLQMINKEKKMMMVDSEDIVITIESDYR